MLYFLVFIIPFTVLMIYLTKRNKLIKEKYNTLQGRLSLILEKEVNVEKYTSLKELAKGAQLTYEDIKALERVLHQVEERNGRTPSRFISNTFNSRLKQLDFIEEKLRNLEKSLAPKEQPE